MNDKNEQMAIALEKTGRFRVLRKLQPRASGINLPGLPVRQALFLDLETTGLDAKTDEVIEIALVPFTFADDGAVVGLLPSFDGLRQPSKPIPPKITALTGITDEMAAKRTLDSDVIAAMVKPAEWIISHHARFDRPFAERLHPDFASKAWACSMTQALWNEHGFDGTKLKYLLTSAGFFHDGHRALDDCHAAIELLAGLLGKTERTALAHILKAASKATLRIWAVGAAYDKKDLLRSRSYRWNAGDDGRPRAWYLDVDEDSQEDEIAFLRAKIFGPAWKPITTRITALDRFSDRV